MMKKINIIQIFFLLSLIITICLINTTYAKYTENINPNLHVTLNQWLIKVNEQDIMGEESFENILATKNYVYCYKIEYVFPRGVANSWAKGFSIEQIAI